VESSPKLRHKKTKFLCNIQDTQNEIKDTGADVRQYLARLIDCEVNDLLQELQSLKLAAEEEVDSYKHRLHMALAKIKSCRISSLELISKGSPSEITQADNDVLVGTKNVGYILSDNIST